MIKLKYYFDYSQDINNKSLNFPFLASFLWFMIVFSSFQSFGNYLIIFFSLCEDLLYGFNVLQLIVERITSLISFDKILFPHFVLLWIRKSHEILFFYCCLLSLSSFYLLCYLTIYSPLMSFFFILQVIAVFSDEMCFFSLILYL